MARKQANKVKTSKLVDGTKHREPTKTRGKSGVTPGGRKYSAIRNGSGFKNTIVRGNEKEGTHIKNTVNGDSSKRKDNKFYQRIEKSFTKKVK